MIWFILIGIILLGIGAVLGWKARTWKDEFDHDIDMIFEEALRNKE